MFVRSGSSKTSGTAAPHWLKRFTVNGIPASDFHDVLGAIDEDLDREALAAGRVWSALAAAATGTTLCM
jgi:hypothetical protein